MAGEGYPAGGSGSMSAAQILRRLTAASTLAVGAMLFGAGTASLTTLAAGTNGYVLTMAAGVPSWALNPAAALPASYVIGDTLYASSTSALSRLAAGTNGYVLTMAAGVPSWALNPAAALPASYVIGDTLYASSTSALSRLAAVAVGQALISNGVGVAPSWSASPLFTGIVTAKPTTTAGIALDPNAATGNFTLSLSPANITATRRWSFPDRSDTVAGLGAQTFTGAQVIGTDPGGSELLRVGGGIRATAASSFSTVAPIYPAVLSLDLGATPGYSQLSCRANNAGAIGLLVYDVNNLHLMFDVDYNLGFKARAVNGFKVLKSASSLNFDYCVGQTIGSAVSGFSQALSILSTGAVIIGTDPGGSALLRVGGSLFNSLGTITTAQQAIDSAVTWNSGATAFTGWKLNVTDTASAAGSLLLDLQVGGVSKFSVRKDSLITMSGLSYSGATNGELWYDSSAKIYKFFGMGVQQNQSTTIHTGSATAGAGPSNTVVATSLLLSGTGTKTIPANFWSGGTAARIVRITLTGLISNTGTPTLTLLVKLGSTTITSTGAVTMTTGATGHTTVVVTLVCAGVGVSGQVNGTLRCLYPVAGSAIISQASQGNVVIDTTAAQTIDVTAQFGTANASNYMLMTVGSIELIGG